MRPLLRYTREQTGAYCEEHGLRWRDDESNDTAAYARNRIRRELVPALARIHPILERIALVLVGIVAVVWAVRTGNWIFGVFVGIATLGAVRAGTPRASARPLDAVEWIAAVSLWLIALGLCMGVIAFASVGPGSLS